MYTPEQLAAIQCGVDETLADAQGSHGFITCEWSDRVVQRGADQFALFGPMAYKIFPAQTIDDEGMARLEYLPAFSTDGRVFGMWPDEGRGGLLTLMRMTMRRGREIENPVWTTIFVDGGWLHTHELALTNEEVDDILVKEIMAGKNVLTRKPPGWV